MRRTTLMHALWRADHAVGSSLTFANCKGGCFSTQDAHGLCVAGTTISDGTRERCVKADSRVRVRGKNLWAYPTFGESIYAGVTFTAGPDGILVNGTAASSISYNSTDVTAALTRGVSYVTAVRADDLPKGVYPYFVVTTSSGNRYLSKFTFDEDVSRVLLYIAISKGTVFDHVLLLPQYEVGTAATAFEPYMAPYDIAVPCDLREGERWFPASGRLERMENGALRVEVLPSVRLPSRAGTVVVDQVPVEEAATLSATMLVRRLAGEVSA